MPRTPRKVPPTAVPEVADEAARLVGSLFRHLHRVPDLQSAILFGSSVDGTFDKSSDVDVLLLFDADNPERTHAGPVQDVLRTVRQETRTPREVTPVYASAFRPKLESNFLANVARTGLLFWARAQTHLPPASDAARVVAIHWDAHDLTPAQKARIHRTLFGDSGTKQVGGRPYHWKVPGLIPTEYRYGPGYLVVPQAEAARVLRALRDLGLDPNTSRFIVA